jgi:imidazolonepropionase-like amidohydrolase
VIALSSRLATGFTLGLASLLAVGAASALPGAAAQQAADTAPRTSWTVAADRIHTATGRVIENGFVRVENGRIVAMGPGDAGADFHVAAITPGLVEASSGIALGETTVEQASETTPEVSLEEGLDLFSTRWAVELSGGVTTTLALPFDENVLGGLPVVVKTGGGEPTLESRVVKARVLVRGAFGDQPSRSNSPFSGTAWGMYHRLPTTRMGVEYEFRRAFYEAIRARNDASYASPGAAVLQQVLAGELPLMVRASARLDVRTALALKAEFGLPKFIVDGAGELLEEEELVVASGAAFVFAPLTFDGNTGIDGGVLPWNTPARLAERGVTFALSGSSNANREYRLALQPGHAMRGGLPFEKALEAVTITPARLLGVADRVGSIEAGKDADLVFWSGTPFEYTSRITGVMVSGELAVDPRAAQ